MLLSPRRCIFTGGPTIENTELDALSAKARGYQDDADIAFTRVKLLEQEGLSGDITATGSSARDLLQKNHYSLLLDLMLMVWNCLEN